ncbi:zinc-binding dehydrogenase [Nocardia sp. NPDC058519]|uniref:zinc-binding dehydrogenase n=1 Tax=Nocardia sp. NPDC058519 TaxID=3346535 RepID=UPI00364BB5F7
MDPVSSRLTTAAIWIGGADVVLRRVEIPELTDGEILVRVRLATVCGSDLHTVTGRRSGACPSILGHEAVGDVVAVGAGAPVSVGQRIVWSVTVACGDCARCRAGRTAKCSAVRKVGHEPFHGDWPLSGAYAEHIVLPHGTATAVVPPGLPDSVAAPAACATATVMATIEAAGSVRGRRVLVAGAGMLGLTAVAACSEAGAEVQAVDIDPERLTMAPQFGAVTADTDPVDIAIDFTGSANAIDAALRRLDIGGVLVLAGSVAPGPSLAVDPETLVRRWLTITGVHNYEPRHLGRAVDFLHRTVGRYPWYDVVADPVPLAQLSTALHRPPTGILRTAVAPQL